MIEGCYQYFFSLLCFKQNETKMLIYAFSNAKIQFGKVRKVKFASLNETLVITGVKSIDQLDHLIIYQYQM